jgi:hypothetical protein
LRLRSVASGGLKNRDQRSAELSAATRPQSVTFSHHFSGVILNGSSCATWRGMVSFLTRIAQGFWSMSEIATLRQLTRAPPVAHTLSRVVASDHTPIGIPRNVNVHAGPSGLNLRYD